MTGALEPALNDAHQRILLAKGKPVLTDCEGYMVNRDDWSEDFVRALAASEGIQQSDEHWPLITFLREYYAGHGVLAGLLKTNGEH